MPVDSQLTRPAVSLPANEKGRQLPGALLVSSHLSGDIGIETPHHPRQSGSRPAPPQPNSLLRVALLAGRPRATGCTAIHLLSRRKQRCASRLYGSAAAHSKSVQEMGCREGQTCGNHKVSADFEVLRHTIAFQQRDCTDPRSHICELDVSDAIRLHVCWTPQRAFATTSGLG